MVSILNSVTKKKIFVTSGYSLQVMGIVPPETVLEKGDVLLLFGAPHDLEDFIGG